MEGSGERDKRGQWSNRGGKGLGGSSRAGACGTPGVCGRPPENRERAAGIWETEVRGIRAVRAAEDPFGDVEARNPRGRPSAEGTGLLPVVWG